MAKTRRAKAKGKAAKPEPRRFTGLRLGMQVIGGLGLMVGLLLLFDQLGTAAKQQVPAQPRYAVPLEELQFDTPAYIDRTAFLAEVQYLSQLPDTVQAIDPHLQHQLQSAFLQHPWVADLGTVRVQPDLTIHLPLQWREPALAIQWHRGDAPSTRVVDNHGILLPREAPTIGLPRLLNVQQATHAEAGQPWPNQDVPRAAELVRRYTAETIERTAMGWVLREHNGQTLTIATPEAR